MRLKSTLPATIVLYVALSGCQQAAPPAPERVENPEIGIAVAALPEAFTVAQATGEIIKLQAPGEVGPGTATIAVGEISDYGINLVEKVKARREWFESQEGGRYLGNRELGTPHRRRLYRARLVRGGRLDGRRDLGIRDSPAAKSASHPHLLLSRR